MEISWLLKTLVFLLLRHIPCNGGQLWCFGAGNDNRLLQGQETTTFMIEVLNSITFKLVKLKMLKKIYNKQ